jgi:hypothetical protein
VGSAYSDAIDATRDTIVERARSYKRLVIAVSLGTVAAATAAIGLQDLRPLLALALLPSLVLNHVRCDLQKVLHWRARLLSAWGAGELQLRIFGDTIRRVPALPSGTVEGMLDCLPDWDGQQTTPGSRAALAAVQSRIGRAAEAALGIRALAWGATAMALTLALLRREPLWLLLCPLAAGLAAAWLWHARRRLDTLLKSAPQALADAADITSFERGRAGLNWQGHRRIRATPGSGP